MIGGAPALQAPGGESIDLRARVMAFVADLASGRHLIFTHGVVR